MNNSISQNFTWKSLLRFAFSTTIMMIFMSLYTMIDGFFVARFVGPDALAAINIVYPVIGVAIGLGVMLGSGGSAIISRLLGQKKHQEAAQNFTRISLFALFLGLGFSGISLLFIDPLLIFLGASERLMPYCQDFLSVLLPFLPALLLQVMLGVLFVTAGKPKLGLCLTLFAGLLNGFLDYLFIVVLNMGISGAAWATSTGYLITPVFALFYFAQKKTDLYFARHSFDYKVILETCINGSSELVINFAGSVIAWLMNLTMMRFAGESGVAAVTVVLYTQFIFTSIFLGFSNGVAPIIGYNHGSQNIE
ncbi:MAG: MATE family efflux transporter [Acetobacterium sp.]